MIAMTMKAVIFMIQSLVSGEWRLSNEPESWIIVQYLGVVLYRRWICKMILQAHGIAQQLQCVGMCMHDHPLMSKQFSRHLHSLHQQYISIH
jgi:hypothetical protein